MEIFKCEIIGKRKERMIKNIADYREKLHRYSFERRARNMKIGKDGGKIDGVQSCTG